MRRHPRGLTCQIIAGGAGGGMSVYDFTIKLLSLFLIPFQTVFMDSVFGSVFLFLIAACPVVLLFKLWRHLRKF